jgi:hypothetical protein
MAPKKNQIAIQFTFQRIAAMSGCENEAFTEKDGPAHRNATAAQQSLPTGLPDGIFAYQKYQFWYILHT